MKTKLLIVFLMISTITFAQKNNDNSKEKWPIKIKKITNDINKYKAIHLKIDDIKGDSNDKSSKRTIKIGGAEKPYARFSTPKKSSNSKASFTKFYRMDGESSNTNAKRKLSNQQFKEKSINSRRRGDVKLEDIQITKKASKMRRRVNKTKRKRGKTNNQYLHSL